MSTLVVGDVHGHVQVVERALEHDGPVVFLGDLVDSYNICIADQLKCVGLVLDAVDNNKAVLIGGNHEYSYLLKDQRCSGFNHNLFTDLVHSDYLGRMRQVLKTHRWLPCTTDNPELVLLSHAGFNSHKSILDNLNLINDDDGSFTVSKFNITVAEAAKNQDSWFYWAGRERGGRHIVGGPIWNDASTFIPIPRILQIFGHTPQKSPKNFSDGSMCINVQDGNFVGVIVEDDGTIGDFVYVK